MQFLLEEALAILAEGTETQAQLAELEQCELLLAGEQAKAEAQAALERR